MPRSRLFACLVFLALASSAAAVGQTAFTAKVVNLRAGPSRDYPLVTHLGPGVAVQVAGCVDDWTWCDVIAGPDRGWIYAGNLVYPYQGRRVVVLDDGPTIGFPIVSFSIGPYWDSYYRSRPWYGRRSYWIGRPPPPHWIGLPRPHRPAPPPHRPRPPVARPPARPHRPPPPPRPRPGRPGPRAPDNPQPPGPPGARHGAG